MRAEESVFFSSTHNTMARLFVSCTLLILVCLSCVPHGEASISPSQLLGQWTNSHNSTMSIEHVDNGDLGGWYHTGVGNASGKHKMVGRYSLSDDGRMTLGWTVSWQGPSDSTTSWSGQVVLTEDESMMLATSWFLALPIHYQSDRWRSVLAGEDYFHRSH